MTTDPPHARGRGASGPRRLLLLLLVGLPLGLLGAEGAMRVHRSSSGRPHDAESRRAALRELRSRLVDPLPRAGGAEPPPDGTQNNTPIVSPYFATDSLGALANHEANLRDRGVREPGRLRIVLLGGSVAGIFGLSGARRLREELQRTPELAETGIDVMTYARGGHKQPQQLLRLSHLLAVGMQPDVVLNIDGFNEVALVNQGHEEGMHPSYPSYVHWMKFARHLGQDEEQHALVVAAEVAKARLVEEVEEQLASSWIGSALCAPFFERRIAARRRDYEAKRDAYLEGLDADRLPPGVLGPPFEGTSRDAVRTSVRLWMESSRQMRALCEANDVVYLHVLQPTLHDVDAKPMTPEEEQKGRISRSWLEAVRFGYPLLRAGGRALASEGVAFHDATSLFAEVRETLYYDNCHFDGRGNELLAEAITEQLAPLLAR